MLTQREKAVVSYYLATRATPRKFLWDLSPYLLPPIVFGGYGLWKPDFTAKGLGFAVLLVLALWSLVVPARMSVPFYTALAKYEHAVRALEKPTVPDP